MKITNWCVAVAVALACVCARAALVVNEVCYDNSAVADETGDTSSDWIELYNPGPGAVSLNGLTLSDDNDNGLRFRIPDGLTINAGAKMTFLADDDAGQNKLACRTCHIYYRGIRERRDVV